MFRSPKGAVERVSFLYCFLYCGNDLRYCSTLCDFEKNLCLVKFCPLQFHNCRLEKRFERYELIPDKNYRKKLGVGVAGGRLRWQLGHGRIWLLQGPSWNNSTRLKKRKRSRQYAQEIQDS